MIRASAAVHVLGKYRSFRGKADVLHRVGKRNESYSRQSPDFRKEIRQDRCCWRESRRLWQLQRLPGPVFPPLGSGQLPPVKGGRARPVCGGGFGRNRLYENGEREPNRPCRGGPRYKFSVVSWKMFLEV